MYDLSGKIALVTGMAGRRGIGQAVATRLASEGAYIVVADVSPRTGTIRPDDQEAGWQGLESVVAEIEEMGCESLALVADISGSARMAAFLASSESDYVTGLSMSVSGGLEMN